MVVQTKGAQRNWNYNLNEYNVRVFVWNLCFQNGCMVTRCRLASCLMTPIYARRAFAHANSGTIGLHYRS